MAGGGVTVGSDEQLVELDQREIDGKWSSKRCASSLSKWEYWHKWTNRIHDTRTGDVGKCKVIVVIIIC